MKDLRLIIAKNIQKLRTESRLTQLELAEILNYSDKAVSKWERAEAIPDITVLKRIADHFSVTVDYLLEEEHTVGLSEIALKRMRSRNRLIIALVSIFGVFALATFLFALLLLGNTGFSPWLLYIYATAISALVGLVFNCVWGIKKLNLLIISLLIWTALTSIYLTVLSCFGLNWWVIYFIGIPAQAILLVLSGMGSTKRRKEIEDNVTDTDAATSAKEAE